MRLAEALRELVDDEVGRFPAPEAAAAVDRLIEQYRSGQPPDRLILDREIDAAVYAAYRMPATYAGVAAALAATAEAQPGMAPNRLLDVGGGTGAALWAAAATWPSLGLADVVDGSAHALRLGERLSRAADDDVVRTARWRQANLPGELDVGDADLVTMSYVLGELTEGDRSALIARISAAQNVVVVEPGTPAGYSRVMAARNQLLEAGLRIVAPCPVQTPCPLGVGDWCHFAARVARSPLHRRLKGGDLGHEDEKYSYVAATRLPAGTVPAARILRHPAQRKGLVTLELCTPDGLETRRVGKSKGDAYRRARRAAWGDSVPD
jgi:ribosomal protein RSM22 (predicted rRNA methylase)